MSRVYIIAEAGVNHNGSLQTAFELIDIAAAAGADAVKFQVFRAGDMTSRHAPKADYQKAGTSLQENQMEMLQKLQLSETQYRELYKYCLARNIDFLASPFDTASADFLTCRLKLPLIKIASGEITNAPLLVHIARTGKKVILSTGMSSLGEVETALGFLAFGYIEKEIPPSREAFQTSYALPQGQAILQEKVMLLHCTSEYPAPFASINLLAMDTLRQAFNLPVGFSDHSTGIHIAIAAAARGACIIEKHFTLDKTLPGPDHQASLEPAELTEMIKAIRQVELALGSGVKTVSSGENKNCALVRKSLVTARPIQAGECFSVDNIAVKRPGTGMSPLQYWDIIGQPAQKSYAVDEMVKE